MTANYLHNIALIFFMGNMMEYGNVILKAIGFFFGHRMIRN